LGTTEDQEFLKLIGKKCQAFVAQSDRSLKQSLVKMLNSKRKVMPLNAIHQQAYISGSSTIGHGNFVDAGVLINAHAQIGSHNIFHAQCALDAEVGLKEFVEVGLGSNIGANVKIGKGVFIGAGVTIVAGVNIGDYARIGAGSVVIADVGKNETVFGNPARKVDR
jgi:sugar O-acyltransferase (sialic acid O-acetyltransferase NeuD family)